MDNGRSQEGEEEDEKRETRMSTTFPTDMIMEILSRLPVKSLLKFRCVSKDWCFLISTPFFITQNLNRLTYHHNYDYVCGGSHGLLHMRVSVNLEYTVTILDIPFKRESDHVKLLGTCNGLLCLFIGKRAYNRPYYRYIHVWNPATKEYNKFSDSFIAPKSTMRRRIVDTVVGLGFDHINNEYKLIKIVYFFEGNRFAGPFQNCVMVCSLKNGQWKNLGNIPYIMKAVKSHAVLNGAIHWMATKGYALNSSSELILSFDLQREVFLEIPQPNYGDGDKECEVTLGECGGFLSLLRLIFNKRVEVWLMKDYGVKESWIKSFNISWSEFDVLEIWKNYGIHDFLWRRNMPRRVWSSLDLKKEGDIRTDCRPWWCCQSFKYVESLVPLRVYQAEDQQQGRGDED